MSMYDTPKEQPLIDLSDKDANMYDNKGRSNLRASFVVQVILSEISIVI